MLTNLDKEISSIKDRVRLPRRLPNVNDMMTGYRKMYFFNGPGLLIDINHKTKNLYPTCFNGANIIFNSELSEGLTYNFNLNLDKSELEYYKPYNKYIGRESKKYSNELNKAGFSNLVFQHDFSKEMKCTILAHVQHLGAGSVECVMDYYGNNYTGSVSLSNVGISSGELAVHYLREVNKNLILGAEVAVQAGQTMMMEAARVNIVGSYNHENKALITGSVGSKGLQACLFKKSTEQFSLGSILDFCFESKKATASLACQWVDKEFILRTSLDTNGRVGINLLRSGVYTDNNVDVNMVLSAMTNFTNKTNFGIGFDVTM